MSTDVTLFEGTAGYYSKYRSGYDVKLYEEISRKAGLNRDSVILDVGTGTGTIAHNLAPLVKVVYALDPSEEMLDEARRIAEEKGIENVTFYKDVAENVDRYNEFSDIDLVTFGASLHWIQDIDTMLSKVANVLKPGGWFSIQFGALIHIWSEDPEQEWRYDVTNIVKKYLGEERRAGDGYFKDKTSRKSGTFEEKLLAHRELFCSLCRIEVEHATTWTPDRVIGFLYSTSFARRGYFGEQVSSFEEDIRDLFAKRGFGEWQETERHIALMAQNSK